MSGPSCKEQYSTSLPLVPCRVKNPKKMVNHVAVTCGLHPCTLGIVPDTAAMVTIPANIEIVAFEITDLFQLPMARPRQQSHCAQYQGAQQKYPAPYSASQTEKQPGQQGSESGDCGGASKPEGSAR
jgi:hypothetical protein